MMYESDTVLLFGAEDPGDTLGPIARRIAARKAAERAAIGRPSVLSAEPLAPVVRRALAGQLPAKVLR